MALTTLRKEREKARMTQADLSRVTGVSQAVISNIEKGVTRSPRFDTVRRLATALGFDIKELEIEVHGDER